MVATRGDRPDLGDLPSVISPSPGRIAARGVVTAGATCRVASSCERGGEEGTARTGDLCLLAFLPFEVDAEESAATLGDGATPALFGLERVGEEGADGVDDGARAAPSAFEGARGEYCLGDVQDLAARLEREGGGVAGMGAETVVAASGEREAGSITPSGDVTSMASCREREGAGGVGLGNVKTAACPSEKGAATRSSWMSIEVWSPLMTGSPTAFRAACR